MAACASLAAPNDRAGLRECQSHHLLVADCPSIRRRAVPITRVDSQTARREVAEIRHPSLYAPRDFDISPYFMVVKSTLARVFNYTDAHWAGLPRVRAAQVTLAPEIEGAITEVAYARFSRRGH